MKERNTLQLSALNTHVIQVTFISVVITALGGPLMAVLPPQRFNLNRAELWIILSSN